MISINGFKHSQMIFVKKIDFYEEVVKIYLQGLDFIREIVF